MNDFRIALVDGDAAIRSGRRLLLDSQQDMQVVYEESQAAVALETLPDLLVDAIIIDHRLQGIDGVTLAKDLVARMSAQEQVIPAIIITGSYFTFELLMASIRAGATELVTQDSPASNLLEAIRKSRRAMADVKLKPFADFLDANDYEPVASADYLLKLSRLDAEEREIVEALSDARELESLTANLGLSRGRVRELLESTMRIFECATIEQLYLLIRDSSRSG